ncbi:MAG TPA: efflux RND transporter periplasmic adaptor subunit [Rhizomicrobium sp.]
MFESLLRRWRTTKPSYRAAIVILVLVVAWIGSGQLGAGNHSNDKTTAKTADIPHVRVRLVESSNRDAVITVRGHTQALHSVDVRAELDGVVQALHFEKGDRVRKGQILCEIKTNDRAARLAEAQALVAQTGEQHQVDLDLAQNGFRSKTQVAQSAASLEAARAQQRTMEIQLENTQIRAPFDGLVDDRYVDVGDFMRAGDKCALLIAPEPFLAVGQVSEREVGEMKIGDPASAKLVTGETVEGKIRFVANRADDTTRTFRVEVDLPNPDGHLKDGVSADIRVPVRELKAVKISPGILVLDDNGVVGVRAVENGIVHFHPVQIVSDNPDGMWVSGIDSGLSVITVGQSFVNEGEHVMPVPEGSKRA